MGGKSDGSCRSWVDDIYWTHFKFLHFVQFLRSGYDQYLALPKTFSSSLKKKLPENVGLKGPGGDVWNIGLTTRDDTLYFTNGWQQFLKDHSLRENDFLVFKYNGESLFEVLIFDGKSFCEKAASYFVRKCEHTEHVGGYLIKNKDTDTSLEEVNTHSNVGVDCVSPEKSVHPNIVIVPEAVPSETPSEKVFNAGVESASPEQFMDADGVEVPAAVPSQTTAKRVRKQVSTVRRVQTNRRGRLSNASNASQVVNLATESEPEPEPEPEPVGRSGSYDIYTSNRRPVTEYDINNALQSAQAVCTNDSLYIIMRPTHVYKRFYLSIPNKWILQHVSLRSQDVILRIGGTEWLAKYSLHRVRQTGGLSGGWKHFALDNNLEEFDVCVFKPAGQINNSLIIDVKIFRVVEEITPLTMIKSPAKRGRKK